MYELTAQHCQDVGGAFAPLAGLAFAVTLISASGPIYDFVSGFFDGFNKL